MTLIILIIISTLCGNITYASVYNEIPKTFIKNSSHAKEIKFGYDLSNNSLQDSQQKKTTFLIEGILKNSIINHTSRYQISNAITETAVGSIVANTGSTLFRTNTIIPLKDFTKEENPISITGIIYGRFYDFHDKAFLTNSTKDMMATFGIGFSRTNIYTFGLSVGRRITDVFFGTTPDTINEYIYRPSFIYTDKLQNTIPHFIKKMLEQSSILKTAISDITIKAEYAHILAKNTNIAQLLFSVEKQISKHLAISFSYDREVSKTSNRSSNLVNTNIMGRISTDLIIKL